MQLEARWKESEWGKARQDVNGEKGSTESETRRRAIENWYNREGRGPVDASGMGYYSTTWRRWRYRDADQASIRFAGAPQRLIPSAAEIGGLFIASQGSSHSSVAPRVGLS